LRIGGDAGLRDKVADSGAILSELGMRGIGGRECPSPQDAARCRLQPQHPEHSHGSVAAFHFLVHRPVGLADAAAEAVARVLALFDDRVGCGKGPDDFEAAEQDALAAMKEVSCLVLRSVIELGMTARPASSGRGRSGTGWRRPPGR